MFVPKIIRKLLGVILGGSGSKEIYLGCFLGLLLGLIPGFNLTTLIIIFLILILNINLGSAIIFFFIGEILCFSLTPLTFQIGKIIIYNPLLEPIFVFICNKPILALLSFDTYCLVGGLVVGIILGIIFSVIFTSVIQRLRKALIKSTSNKFFNKLANTLICRILLKIIFFAKLNKQHSDGTTTSPLIRKGAVYSLLVIIAMIITFNLFFIQPTLKSFIRSNLERINGAEVNINSVSFSLLRGSFKIDKLQMTDATEPSKNLIYVKTVVSDINVLSLLTKRIVFDKTVLKGAKLNSERNKPGEVFSKRKSEISPDINISDEKVDKDSPLNILDKNLLKKVKKYKKYLRTIQKIYKISTIDFMPSWSKGLKYKVTKKDKNLLNKTAQNLITEHPKIVFKKIVTDLDNPYPMDLVLHNFSTDPLIYSFPMELSITPKKDKTKPSLYLLLAVNKAKENNFIKLRIKRATIKDFNISKKLNYGIEKAKLNILLRGKFSPQKVNLPGKMELSNLKFHKSKNLPTSLDSIDEIDFFFNIAGSIENLQLIPDTEKNAEVIKELFKSKGKDILKDTLSNAIDESTKDKDVKKIKDKLFKMF